MKKVEIYSNWCYCDSLDGIVLKDGERIKVQWPDKTTSKEVVHIEDCSYTGSDHGHPCDIKVTKAYVKTLCKGVKSLVRLYDSGCLCKRV